MNKGVTTDIQLMEYAKRLKIPNFRGVFMRTNLPKKIKVYESGIVNLDDANGSGTHWVAYKKKKNNIFYFDSFGNLQPPIEVLHYFRSDNNNNQVMYNHKRYQAYNTANCGQLCLNFLVSSTS